MKKRISLGKKPEWSDNQSLATEEANNRFIDAQDFDHSRVLISRDTYSVIFGDKGFFKPPHRKLCFVIELDQNPADFRQQVNAAYSFFLSRAVERRNK